jgi:anti-sigma regulatory factor (Ser/Thr protein kinase)
MHSYDKKGRLPFGALDLRLAENVQHCQVFKPAELTQVLTNIAASMKAKGFPAKDVSAVILKVYEATRNAFRHGKLVDFSKPVRINYLVMEDEVVIRVEDQGPTFSRRRSRQ